MYLSHPKVSDSSRRTLKLRHHFSTGDHRSLEITAFLSLCGQPPITSAGGQFCALNHRIVQVIPIVLLILFLLLYNASVHEQSNDLTWPDDSRGDMKAGCWTVKKTRNRGIQKKLWIERQKTRKAKNIENPIEKQHSILVLQWWFLLHAVFPPESYTLLNPSASFPLCMS